MPLKLSQIDTNQLKEVEAPKTGLSAGTGTFAKGVGVGAVKSVGELALGVGQLGRGIQNKLGLNIGNQTSSPFDTQNAERIRETTLKANAPGQGTGKFLGTAAQYLMPTSGIVRGQQILGTAARSVPTMAGRLTAKAGARFLPEAVGTGAVSYLRNGGDVDEAKKDAVLAGGFSVGLGALGGLARSTYWPALDDSVTKALGVQGKKSGTAALKQTAQKTAGLKVLKDRAKNLTVTLDDGTKAAFDPNNASYSTTLQAWNKARQNVFNEYTTLSKKAGVDSTVDLAGVRDQIAAALDAPILGIEKRAVRSLLKDFDNVFQNPKTADLQTAERFVKSLNENTVQGFFSGTSDAAASKVNAGTAKLIRDLMDDVIEQSTGGQYQGLRSQYAALKSIEDDLVRKFQQDARSIGGGLPEYTGAFASGDIVGSALSLDPAQFAKGATLGTFSVLKRKLSNPERFLRRSFDLIDDTPKDLPLRIFGGQKALSASDAKVADAVADSVNNPGVGMSIRKTVTPASVAKRIDKEDFRRIAKILDNVDAARLSKDAKRLLDDMGLGNATDSELRRFLREVIDEYEGVAERAVTSRK